MQKFRGYCFSLFFMLWTMIVCSLGMPFIIVRKGKTSLITAHFWARTTLWVMEKMVGLRYEVRGLENVPEGSCVIACKHQSAFDTCVFHKLFDKTAYVYKKELTYVPFVRWHLRNSGSIAVDRSSGTTAMRTLLEGVKKRISQGFKIVIFPEGTRVGVDEKKEYNPGVAFLYDKIKDLKVVPAALNSGLFWGRYSFEKRPGTIIIEFLPAIDAGMSKREFLQLIENNIEKTTKKLIEEDKKV